MSWILSKEAMDKIIQDILDGEINQEEQEHLEHQREKMIAEKRYEKGNVP